MLLATVMRNLVDNAIKYSLEHSVIIIRSEAIGKKVHISIRNKTTGLDSRQLIHLFDRFYQSDVHQSDAGFGLGLAIIRQIAEAHNGTVTARLNGQDEFEIDLTI